MNRIPKTLVEAIRYFGDADTCLAFVANLRWPNGPECPRCKSHDLSFLKTRRLWKCLECKKQFSVKVGTTFEDSPVTLDKWLVAMWMVSNCKNGISSYEVARALGVAQRTAWFMLHRIRLAMQTRTFSKLTGVVEVDETFIGGKARNMHVSKRKQRITGTGGKDKTAVMGILERGGEVRLKVVPNRRKQELQRQVRNHVAAGSAIYTDALQSYDGLEKDFAHEVVDHAEAYVNGKVHTNGMENFWSLLKRGLKGTYVSVKPFHLFRYLDEQAYRYNQRRGNDAARFLQTLQNIVGRRLTWKQVTGATAQ